MYSSSTRNMIVKIHSEIWISGVFSYKSPPLFIETNHSLSFPFEY